MKMTKIAFWRKVKENCEKNKIVPCTGIYDSDCPYGTGSKECKMCEGGNGKEALAYAEAYIKRHEQKSKKRIIPKYTADVQPDTTGSELKKIVMKATVKQNLKLAPIQCCKCVRVETCKRKEKELSILPSCDGYVSNESMMYVHTVDPNEKKVESVMTTTSDPTPLEIAKMIRDNNYICHGFKCTQCPLRDFMEGEGCGSGVKDGSSRLLRKQLIDSYIKANEPACEHLVGDLCGNAFETCDKECLANSEILKPEPVTVKAFEGCEHLKDGDCTRYMPCGDTSCPAYKPEPIIEPIKFQLPKIAFVVFADGIGVRGKNFTIDSDGNLTHSGCLCYDNIDKAVAVAKKNWGLK